MGLPIIIAGIILFAAAAKNQLSYLASNLETDLSGYFKWALAILAVGTVGIVKPLRPFSDALLLLVILVIVLKNGKSIFANLQSLKPTTPPTAPNTPAEKTQAPPSSAGATAISLQPGGALSDNTTSDTSPVTSLPDITKEFNLPNPIEDLIGGLL